MVSSRATGSTFVPFIQAYASSIPPRQREIPDAEQCCGSVGVYHLLEPASAQQIGKRKADHILALRPEILVTANPGCTLQIRSQLGSAGSALRTAHPIEVLDASIRGTRI